LQTGRAAKEPEEESKKSGELFDFLGILLGEKYITAIVTA
jgi:hypothetical protein